MTSAMTDLMEDSAIARSIKEILGSFTPGGHGTDRQRAARRVPSVSDELSLLCAIPAEVTVILRVQASYSTRVKLQKAGDIGQRGRQTPSIEPAEVADPS